MSRRHNQDGGFMKDVKLGKSEATLVKNYCSRVSDDDLGILMQLLPQTLCGDRSSACSVFQHDKEVDRWLMQASSAEDWFIKADAIGDAARSENETRQKRGSK
jgi:hypothetical protein